MLGRLQRAQKRAVGLKQVMRAITNGEIERVLLADDVDARLERKVLFACSDAGIEAVRGYNMLQLGKACKIDVGAAVVGWRDPV